MQAQPQPRSAARSRQKARRSNVAAALLPRLVLYYNRWTGFESHAIREQFRPMTIAEVHAIAAGDVVWMSRDPIHPNGKVYGYARRRITKVECRIADGARLLHFATGFTTVEPQRSTHPCAAVDNPRALTRLIAEQPLATQVSAY